MSSDSFLAKSSAFLVLERGLKGRLSQDLGRKSLSSCGRIKNSRIPSAWCEANASVAWAQVFTRDGLTRLNNTSFMLGTRRAN